MSKKAMLVILDGWGINNDPQKSAVLRAKTPYMDMLTEKFAHCSLITYGPDVGLPPGQMGNSEVGHMNLGAGRVVYQDLMKINKAIENHEINKDKTLLGCLEYVKKEKKQLHIFGVLSDGGIHGHIDHIKAMTGIAAEQGTGNVYLHLFTDGRDTDPKSGLHFLLDLQSHLSKTTGSIATISGRYYAMDRDTRWERTALVWRAMVNGDGQQITDPAAYLEASYQKNITDEFILPAVLTKAGGQPVAKIANGDAVIFTNFRSDRARQITDALSQMDFPAEGMHKLDDLRFLPFKLYNKDHRGMQPLFEKQVLKNVMGEVLESHHKTQLRIAETEKYAHVTYFFNNGREQPFGGEERLIVPSPRDVRKYDEKPEMSARLVKDKAIGYMFEHQPDFICLNFANPDMVAHTGNFEATVKACEVVDACTQEVVEKALELNYDIIILADHGNADYMVNDDGSVNTNHSMMPVPCILVSKQKNFLLRDGRLCDVAPTLLKLLELPVPAEMTGEALTYALAETKVP